MISYKSCAELQDLAKCKLERNYGISIFTLLTVGMVNLSASSLLEQLLSGNTFSQYLLFLLVDFALTAFLSIFQTGICLFFLNMACGQPYKADHLFYGFQNNPKASFTVAAATTFVTFLSVLPFNALRYIYWMTNDLNYMKYALLAYPIGFLVMYPLQLALSQSFYLLVDFPDYTGKQALLASCKLMKKHMGRFFLLQLKFLPLMFLCVFTFFIGFLWLVPYMKMTYTVFFLDIMKTSEQTS